MFDKIIEFEEKLAKFTGAPYAISTDCCTHAIELCLRYEQIKKCKFSAYTYLSIPMTMHKLGISYELIDHKWIGEYQFIGTRIWDSARRLEPLMHKTGCLECVSFGMGKPVDNNRGGAILLDDFNAYEEIRKMRYDGRDLSISPWINQTEFKVGYHYKLNPEECIRALDKLNDYINTGDYKPKMIEYPDCRRIRFV